MTQPIDYRYFDGEPFKLCFGDNCNSLYVQEGILRRIPFFEAALRFTHSIQDAVRSTPSTNTIDLGDCNPKAVADVIHYSMTNNIPSIEDGEGEGNRKPNENAVRLYTQACIIADRFNLETVANGLINRTVEYSDIWALNPSLVTTLVEADHGDSKLCSFMVRGIAYDIRMLEYSTDDNDWPFQDAEVKGSSKLEYESFETICQRIPSSILARILQATQTAKVNPFQAANKNPCVLHTHELTDPCAPPMPDDSNKDNERVRDEGNH